MHLVVIIPYHGVGGEASYTSRFKMGLKFIIIAYSRSVKNLLLLTKHNKITDQTSQYMYFTLAHSKSAKEEHLKWLDMNLYKYLTQVNGKPIVKQ